MFVYNYYIFHKLIFKFNCLQKVNFASLIATNAARHRIAATSYKTDIELLEFGLRRAQGPDGALSASKYSYVGGFDATSNVLASKLYGIPTKGTHAHSYVMSFDGISRTQNLDHNTSYPLFDLKHRIDQTFIEKNVYQKCVQYRNEVGKHLNIIVNEANDGELVAFMSYAVTFPNNFVALVDTYDVLKSGLINFISVALLLHELEYDSVGIRIDSGDLAYLSR